MVPFLRPDDCTRNVGGGTLRHSDAAVLPTIAEPLPQLARPVQHLFVRRAQGGKPDDLHLQGSDRSQRSDHVGAGFACHPQLGQPVSSARQHSATRAPSVLRGPRIPPRWHRVPASPAPASPARAEASTRFPWRRTPPLGLPDARCRPTSACRAAAPAPPPTRR
jgi:hypothetical protein